MTGTPIFGVTYYRTAGGLIAPGRPTLLDDVPTWNRGVTFADDTNVGIGIIRPAPSPSNPAQVINGDYTLSNGETLRDKVINGRLLCANGAVATAENCWVRGPVVLPASPRNLVYTTNGGLITLNYCFVQPQNANYYGAGVGDKNYTLWRTKIVDCVDNLGCFSLAADPDPRVHITVLESWLGPMARFAPDYGGTRATSHDDGIQVQGNIGPIDDVMIDGCRIDAIHSTRMGQPPANSTEDHTQISAIMLTPNQRGGACSITVQNTFMMGGQITVNATFNGLNSSSYIALINNKYEKPSAGGLAAAIAITANLPTSNRTISGQTYLIDGSPVPIISLTT